MTVVVSWNPSETTLATFQNYITEEFKDLSMFIALRAVHHSDLTFECTAPIWAVIKKAIKRAADSLRNGIQKLILNNEDITDLPPLKADGDAVPPVDDQEAKEFKCKDIDQYKMDTTPARGYCLVISMSGKKEDREPGNGKDVEKLRSLFKGTLKFAFKVYKDFSRSQIDELMTNVQKTDHNQSSCFVMFILAHGNTDEDGDTVFYTCDKVEEEGKTVEKCNPYKVSAIKDRLETTKKGLRGKPKLLFIQSCRGGTDNRGVLARDDPNDEESNKIIPFGSDFLMSFATIKTNFSYRNIDGSPFIRHLCYVFNTYRNTHDVLSMMTIVAMRMSAWSGTTGDGLHVKQIPEFTSTLRKFLYFRDASEEN
ncbi:PREDICTED: caspase-3-like [Amphimedon queenslandica]|uniref:Caspase family p20 domain-containing protein n=1 Tax=Amphimedon queenslandica TaxID=400682 RepID=A0A1X7T063_AMPQE|nr:PREDICTED: caspase-3-like [Amphimedon queenslandica]|eukprot:XP_011408474.1 PREDICTED: caspase-3-like [Amphimedon queenslandica]